MGEVMFQHERVNRGHPLIVNTGVDEVSWSYKLHTAKYSTYGGEVIQILSCYIDNMNISGTVRKYKEVEAIYRYFAEYFIIATQGATEHAGEHEHYEQVPMVMTYPPRHWRFEIQPMSAPAFIYSLETVAPKWTIVAHVVDGALDVEQLKRYVIRESESTLQHEKGHYEGFKLIGEISPDSGDPALNPFIAPLTPTTAGAKDPLSPRFEPIKQQELQEGIKHIGDYYTKLLPAYASKNFEDLVQLIGAKPQFATKGHPGVEEPSVKIPDNKQVRKKKGH